MKKYTLVAHWSDHRWNKSNPFASRKGSSKRRLRQCVLGRVYDVAKARNFLLFLSAKKQVKRGAPKQDSTIAFFWSIKTKGLRHSSFDAGVCWLWSEAASSASKSEASRASALIFRLSHLFLLSTPNRRGGGRTTPSPLLSWAFHTKLWYSALRLSGLRYRSWLVVVSM